MARAPPRVHITRFTRRQLTPSAVIMDPWPDIAAARDRAPDDSAADQADDHQGELG
jgi:hypothetical protein